MEQLNDDVISMIEEVCNIDAKIKLRKAVGWKLTEVKDVQEFKERLVKMVCGGCVDPRLGCPHRKRKSTKYNHYMFWFQDRTQTLARTLKGSEDLSEVVVSIEKILMTPHKGSDCCATVALKELHEWNRQASLWVLLSNQAQTRRICDI